MEVSHNPWTRNWGQVTDEDEHIETFEVPLADIPGMIRQGEIRHALVVCAFAHLALAGGLDLAPGPT